jgi:hypothetical protein
MTQATEIVLTLAVGHGYAQVGLHLTTLIVHPTNLVGSMLYTMTIEPRNRHSRLGRGSRSYTVWPSWFNQVLIRTMSCHGGLRRNFTLGPDVASVQW